MGNTGYKGYTTLEKYYTDNGAATGVTKANTIGQADYIAPVYDLSACPTDSTPPSNPSNVTFISGVTDIILSWTASTDNSGVANYEIYLNGTLYGTTTSASATIYGLQPSTSYLVAIVAVDIYNNKSASVGGYCSTLSAYTIDLDISDAEVDSTLQTIAFHITSNYPSYTYASYPSWLTVIGGSGGSRTVSLRTAKNSGVTRYATVEIMYDNTSIATFHLIQDSEALV